MESKVVEKTKIDLKQENDKKKGKETKLVKLNLGKKSKNKQKQTMKIDLKGSDRLKNHLNDPSRRSSVGSSLQLKKSVQSIMSFISNVKDGIKDGISKVMDINRNKVMTAERREKQKQLNFINEIKRRNKQMYKNSEKLNFSLKFKDYLSFIMPLYKPKASRTGLFRYVRVNC